MKIKYWGSKIDGRYLKASKLSFWVKCFTGANDYMTWTINIRPSIYACSKLTSWFSIGERVCQCQFLMKIPKNFRKICKSDVPQHTGRSLQIG